MRNNIKENNIEKSLVAKENDYMTIHNKIESIMPMLKKATGIVFYTATFIVSIAIGYIFIFSVFN